MERSLVTTTTTATATATAAPPTIEPKQRFITAIRGWIHMDNLAEGFARQAANARQIKATHEVEAITLMKQLGFTGSTLQVSGASLQLVRKRTPGTLTWGYLEREIPQWATYSGLTPAQSRSLLQWLHTHRDEKECEMLKKTVGSGSSATH